MKKSITTILLILFTLPVFSHGSDSLRIENLQTKVERVEGFQVNTRESLDNKFTELSNGIKWEYQLLRYLALFGIGLTVTGIFGLWRKGKKHIQDKLKEKFDNIISEKEGDILALINKQSDEKQFIKNKKILVLTAKNGDDTFLRKFFRTMGFPVGNVNFTKVDKYEKEMLKDRDMIFANNEENDMDFALINEFFEESSPESVLFYFNSTRNFYNNPKVEDRLSFANAKTQIYGNLINLFKYQHILKK